MPVLSNIDKLEQARYVLNLRREMMRVLRRIGGFAWETKRTNNGMPTMHYIWNGMYYGFYTCYLGNNGRGNMKAIELEVMKKLREAGAHVFIVGTVSGMEKALDVSITTREVDEVLSRGEMRKILDDWGLGKQTVPGLEAEINKLDLKELQTLRHIFVNRLNVTETGKRMGVAHNTVSVRLYNAIDRIRENLVKG